MSLFYQEKSKLLLQLVEQYDTIAIYRHCNPDCDALGAQFGLKTWIKTYFPEKKVWALGFDQGHQYVYPSSDLVSDEELKNSLAIIVDTANIERVDDGRYSLAKVILKIDHHLVVDDFGDETIVVEGCASTCQILTLLFHECLKQPLTRDIATYLYTGLVTDSINFSANYTSSESLMAGAYLLECGIDHARIQQELFDQDFASLKFKSYLLDQVQLYQDHVAYVILDQVQLDTWNLTGNEARAKVNYLAGIKEFYIWALFTYDQETNSYSASLRSKQVAINEVANAYHGGGHKNACGVKNLSRKEVDSLLSDLANLL